jgi:hypothetical protein
MARSMDCERKAEGWADLEGQSTVPNHKAFNLQICNAHKFHSDCSLNRVVD